MLSQCRRYSFINNEIKLALSAIEEDRYDFLAIIKFLLLSFFIRFRGKRKMGPPFFKAGPIDLT